MLTSEQTGPDRQSPADEQGSGRAARAMTGREWRLLLAMMVADAMATAGFAMVLPGIAAWLRMYKDPGHVGWIVSAYLLVSAVSAALLGKLGDLYGRRRVLIAILIVVVSGALISALGATLGWVIFGRILQGTAGAILPLSIGLARQHLPADKASFSVGVLIATASAAAACSVLAGGMLVDGYGPNSIFVGLAGLGIVALLAVTLWTPHQQKIVVTKGNIDWLGGLLFAVTVSALLIALSNGKSWGWSSPGVAGTAACGVICGIAWILIELRHPDPLVDIRVFQNRLFTMLIMALVCGALGMMQLAELCLLLLQQPSWTGSGLGLSATMASLVKLPANLGGIAASLLVGWLAGRNRAGPALVASAAVMTTAGIFGLLVRDSVISIMILCFAGVAGVSALYAAVSSMIIWLVPASGVSGAAGLMVVGRAMAQGVGAQLIAVVLGSLVVPAPNGVRYPSASAYDRGLIYMLILSAFSLVFALLILKATASRQGSDRSAA